MWNGLTKAHLHPFVVGHLRNCFWIFPKFRIRRAKWWSRVPYQNLLPTLQKISNGWLLSLRNITSVLHAWPCYGHRFSDSSLELHLKRFKMALKHVARVNWFPRLIKNVSVKSFQRAAYIVLELQNKNWLLVPFVRIKISLPEVAE